MSSFKADSRYTRRAYCNDYETPPDSDDEMDPKMRREFIKWSNSVDEELDAFYDTFLKYGAQLFGRAFWQLGRREHFVNMCFKYTQPGATKSKQLQEACLLGSSA